MLPILLLGAGVIVTFDAIAALASQRLGFPYVAAAVGSWLLYGVVAYAAVRRAGARTSLGAATGVMMGLVDATLGWAVAWAIGPGRLAGGLTPARWLLAAVNVAVTGAVFGAVGGYVATRRGSADRSLDRAA